MMDSPVLIQYTVTFDHADSLPLDVQSTLQLHGSFCPIIHQSWSFAPDNRDAIAPGYRFPVFRGDGFEIEGRRGDWVVTDSRTYIPQSVGFEIENPYQEIVICTVEYQPIPQHSQRWAAANIVEPVLEPA